MAINTIAHIADVHIRKSILRHNEYRTVFKNLYDKLRQDNPDRIVIVGDLFHDYIKLEGELLILASEFLNELSSIAKVIITRGNHDIARTSPNRIDVIEALVKTMDNKNIHYLNRTFQWDDENVVWCVWKHGEKRNNPWSNNNVKDLNKIYIDLFHDPINTSSNSEGFSFNSNTYRSPKDFLGDISLFGDIHMLQYLDTKKTKAYCGSLIEQNFKEGDGQFHGYLLWDLKTKTAKEVAVENPYGYFTLDINRFTDFDNLQLKLNDNKEHKHIRIKWKTLPALKNTENQRKVDQFLEKNFSPVSIKHINDFIEENKIEIEEESEIENITKREVIHKIFNKYLKKIGVKDDLIKEIIDLDIEIENRLEIEPINNIQWSILKLKGKNFRSYEDIEIEWENKDGLYQIVGENGVGKSTINQLITYILFGKSLETDFRKKFGDSRFINNKLPVNSCEGSIILEANNEYYGIKRVTSIKKNKEGELTTASTIVSYYKLSSPNDNLNEYLNIEKLNESDRSKTQDRIDEIIGSYENFIRVTLTTSDTLNNILSSDKSVFIDSLLFDSGLNIFDLRLKEFKKYKEELIYDSRLINFNLTDQNNHITSLNSEIKLKSEFIDSSKNKITDLKERREYITKEKERLLESMHQIDQELSSTNELQIAGEIDRFEKELVLLNKNELLLTDNINKLKSSYDDKRLQELLLKKDNHKTNEYEKRTLINKKRIELEQQNSMISNINGKIELFKKDGGKLKKEIENLEKGKVCVACGQSLENLKKEHIEHIKNTITEHEKSMYQIASDIKTKESEREPFKKNIEQINQYILKIEEEIKNDSLNFEVILEEIGKLNNNKLEFEKRENLLVELSTYPVKKENLNLKIENGKNKLQRYNDQKIRIEENNKTKTLVTSLNSQINDINDKIDIETHSISTMETQIKSYKDTIKQKEELIVKFLDFERKEEVRNLYGESIHRDGLPTQILSDVLLPKINNILSRLLESTDFDVYLDKDDLRLKFFYNNHPNAIIDCISASGMERTFAVYSLKIALNQINNKSKSTLLTIDEVMGKLKGEYVDKFIELLHLSKKFYKKVLIIEPTHEVAPDYLLNVEKDSKHISKLILN